MERGGPYPLGECNTIGSQNVDILLDGLGRRHADVRHVRGTFWVVAHETLQPTCVNGEPVARCPLSHGDVLSFARIKLRFEIEEPARL
jgi:hypothetical protein